MERAKLRDGFLRQLWRLNKLDVIAVLREFLEGETAALYYLCGAGAGGATPSQLSEALEVSRARAANILRALREKGYVEMDVSADDRRKMDVRCTAAGRRCFEQKYDFLLRCLDKYVDVLGEEDILALTPPPAKGGGRRPRSGGRLRPGSRRGRAAVKNMSLR